MIHTLDTQSDREQFFFDLYQQVFPKFATFVSKRSGAFDDAKDIFQDSLLIYYERVVSSSRQAPENEQAYLLGIAKHLWYKKNRDCQKFSDLKAANSLEADRTSVSTDSLELLAYLEAVGKKCLHILKSFYYDQASLKQIAQSFGFSSTRSATVQKYKCLEKVRDQVKQKSLNYEDFA